jgi:hypothetical protein
MKNKSKSSIVKEDSPEYLREINNKLTWEEIIARRGKPLSREEAMKKIDSVSLKWNKPRNVH